MIMKMEKMLRFGTLPLLLAITVVSGSPVSAKAAASKIIDSSGAQALPVNADGNKFLDQVTNHVKDLGAYKFDGHLDTLKEKGLSVNSGSFIFKPTSLLRVEVKDGGFKSGSVLVKKRDGTVRAKGGRALLGMKMTLDPDSNMLTLPNGLNILQCDLLSLLQGLRRDVASGKKIYATEAPVQIDSNQLFVLETRDAGQSSQRVFVDPHQLIPVEWVIYKNGKVFSTVKFSNFQQIPNLEEKIFEL